MDAISYTLVVNPLTNGATQYRAVVHRKGTVNQDDIIDRMIKGTTLTRTDAVALIEAQNTAYIDFLKEGYWINTPLLNCKLSIRGNFDSAADSYVVGRNSVAVNTSPGVLLRSVGDNIQVAKDERFMLNPNPVQFLDPNNLVAENVMTPGAMGRVTGYRLAFDRTDLKQGVFLIAADESETRIEMYGKISPSELIFMVPTGLTRGEYELEVRTKVNNESKIRRGALEHSITVL